MDSIRRDLRHTEIDVVQYDDIEQRRFSEWTLAYSGASVYVGRLIGTLAERAPLPHPADVRRLIHAIEELARAQL